MKDKDKRKSEILYLIVLSAIGIGYFFFLSGSSYAMHKDSATFIEWSYDGSLQRGYVLYPIFLKICRGLFGDELYLQVVNLLQCFLALVTSLSLEEYVRKEYSLRYLFGFLSFLAICGIYSYSLPEAVASHYIVTESLTVPCFSLMLLFLLKYINKRSFQPLIFAFGICCIMAYIRPQMVFFVPILVFIVLFNELALFCIRKNGQNRGINVEIKWIDRSEYNNNRGSGFLPLIVLSGFVLATVLGLYFVIMITIHLFSGHTNSQYHEAVTGKVMCVMKETDRNMYEEPVVGGYETLYKETTEIGGLCENFPDSILEYEKVQRILDENMKNGLNVLWRWYRTIQEPVDRKMAYELRNRIISTELDEHKTEYIGIILRLMPSSLVSSIFIQPPQIRLICNIIAFALYMAALALVCIAYHMGLDRKYYVPMIVSLIMIYGNALLSNIVLYGQQRYVVYCFGIFYISLLILLINVIPGLTRDNRKEV